MSAFQIAGWVLVGLVAGAAGSYLHANLMAVVLLKRAARAFREASLLKEPFMELQKEHLSLLVELQDLGDKYETLLGEHNALLVKHLKIQVEYAELLRLVRASQDDKSPGSEKVT